MRRFAHALILSTAVVSTMSMSANAVTCPMISDPVGDKQFALSNVPSDGLDVVSGDIGSDATNVTAVIRVVSLGAGAFQPVVDTKFWFDFRINNHSYEFETIRTAAGVYTTRFNGALGVATLAVDTTAGTLTFTAPRTAVLDLADPDQVFKDLTILTWFGPGSYDRADAPGPQYTDQEVPGCI